MIILKFWGGIGNQLFIYSLYKELESRGKIVKADISNYDNIDIREFVLEELGIKLNYVTELDYFRIQNAVYNKLLWLKYRIKGQDYRYFNSYIEKDKSFDENVLKIDNTCVMGYWQCPKYFMSVEQKVKESIHFPKYHHLDMLAHKIEKANSISVHVRLTDYQAEVNNGLGSVCGVQYYINAINIIRKKIKDPIFYIFSDDIQCAKKLFGEIEDFMPVFLDSHSALEDLYLMGKCRHHIMANSSFSWWGVFLSTYEESVVIVPEIWDVNRPEWDIFKSEWIKAKIK